MKRSAIIFAVLSACVVLFAASSKPSTAQDFDLVAGPKYESRAAWIATVARLDWPPAGSAAFQEQQLRNIIRNIKAQGMNTVVFQAVSRGDAMYPSERLPWAVWLSGQPGQDPGWDPLAVALEETHSLGMEFHAWYNVYRIGDTGTPVSETAEPQHVTLSNPEWVEQRGAALWLNPGFPELREWLVENVMEIVENYDIDAIHFDFIRYDQSGYARDNDLKEQYNPDGIFALSDWRRENINKFVREVYAAVKEAKPWVKVGSTPVGNYDTECWHAVLSGRNAVFQDSRRWAQEQVHDYIAPQLYWTIGSADGSPPFDCLARRWVENSHGRHILVGTAPYRPAHGQDINVRGELPQQIDTTRVAGAQGQIHFRYQHVATGPFGGRYDHPALVPSMDWMPGIPPSTPPGFTMEFDAGENRVELTWETPESAEEDRLRGFAVYRNLGSWVDPDEREHLLAVLGPHATSFVEVFAERPEAGVSYRLVAFTRLGAESEPTHSRWTDFTTVGTDPEIADGTFSLTVPYPNPASGVVRIGYSMERQADAEVRLYDVLGREVKTLASGIHAAGHHDATVDVGSLSSGIYILSLESDGRRETRRLVVAQ